MEPLMLGSTPTESWKDLIGAAEHACHCQLSVDLESYLVFLLMRFTKRPEIAGSVLALEYLNIQEYDRQHSQEALQQVGDKCLLFAGLFPGRAEKRRVRISYFVELGQSAYHHLSVFTRVSEARLFGALCEAFVPLMDVLQTTRELGGESSLNYLQAIELWHDTHSEHARKVLRTATTALPTWFEETRARQ